MSATDDTNAARRGSGSNDLLGQRPKRDVVGLLRKLERHGEDNIWRVAQEAREEIETLRTQLAHWKTFAIHAEGEHAAWKKTATALDEELRALKAAAVDGRTYTQADLLEAVKTERDRCALICDVTPPYPFRPSIEAAHAIRTLKDAP
jgi:glutamate/tyrosine decarboxylase-like PLP-dependent enzyme